MSEQDILYVTVGSLCLDGWSRVAHAGHLGSEPRSFWSCVVGRVQKEMRVRQLYMALHGLA
jgi:hypothetical protein